MVVAEVCLAIKIQTTILVPVGEMSVGTAASSIGPVECLSIGPVHP